MADLSATAHFRVRVQPAYNRSCVARIVARFNIRDKPVPVEVPPACRRAVLAGFSAKCDSWRGKSALNKLGVDVLSVSAQAGLEHFEPYSRSRGGSLGLQVSFVAMNSFAKSLSNSPPKRRVQTYLHVL